MIIMFQVRLIQIEFNTIYENIWFLKLYLSINFKLLFKKKYEYYKMIVNDTFFLFF